MKKALILICTLTISISALADVRSVQKTVPFMPDSKIIYRDDQLVIIEMPDKTSSMPKDLAKKSLMFHEDLIWLLRRGLDQFLSYTSILEQNQIKPFSKVLSKLTPVQRHKTGDLTFEFTIHISSNGTSKLLLETSDPDFGIHTQLKVFDESEVRQIMDLMKLLPDLKKEIQEGSQLTDKTISQQKTEREK